MTAVIGGLSHRWGIGGIGTVSLLYLLVVLPTAVLFGSGPAVFASVAAFLAFDWFHVQPPAHLHRGRPPGGVALVPVPGGLHGHRAAGAAQRNRAEEASRREREARALHELGRILSARDDVDATLQEVAEHLRAA